MKVTVPVRIASPVLAFEKEETLAELQKLGASRVAFTLLDVGNMDLICSQLKELIPYFENRGFETCLWLGGSLMHFSYQGEKFTERVSADGKTAAGRICPLDEKFLAFYCGVLVRLLQTGIKTVLFDDDFRLNFWTGSVGCFCRLHREKQKEILGEDVPLAVMREHILKGGPNRYRRAWRKANADSLLAFAKRLRTAADGVDKRVRLGLCSSPAVWGADGWVTDLVRVLAGENRPLVRIWGAPYSSSRLAYGIGQARLCMSVLEDENFEIMAEGDVYPRPRYCVPAAKLEGFDTAIRASEEKADMLKYALDYHSKMSYERGYAEKAERNKPLYGQIEKYFSGKTSVGFNAIEYLNHIDEYTFEEDFADSFEEVMTFPSINLLGDNSLASVFNRPDGACVLFGRNARFAPATAFSDGAVIDLTAAKILSERGFDVGLIRDNGAIEKNGEFLYERYLDTDEIVWIADYRAGQGFDDVEISSSAVLLTRLIRGKRTYNGVYAYTDENGRKFVVFPFDAAKNVDTPSVFRSYARQRQLIWAYEWFTGKKPAAVCTGNPDLYMVTKKGVDSSLSVGVWNFSDDSVEEPLVCLGEKYKKILFINCTGRLDGDEVRLSKLYPYEFAGFEVKK